MKTQYVRDIKDRDEVNSCFLVKHSALATGKNGKPYMNLILTDSSGDLEARIWDDVVSASGQVVKEAYVRVQGRCQLFQSRRQLVIKSIDIVREDAIDPKDYQPKGVCDVEALYTTLCQMVESMEDPDYRALARAVLIDDIEIVTLLKKAPAAKTIHHAYAGGLIEHIVSVTQLAHMVCMHYGPKVHRDLVYLGAFLHDIGKIWELGGERVTEYTDIGRFIGHLTMGVELVTAKVRLIEEATGRPFPQDKILFVKHVLLAHHGELEYGSPKEPQMLEAIIVHMVDDLDSKVNTISRWIEQDQSLGSWTQLHRSMNRYFYKAAWTTEAL